MTTANQARPAWSGELPFEDTALAVKDTGGSGIPVIYFNGQFATQMHWKKRSSDYSFEAAIRDVDAVLEGRSVAKTDRVVVVGWSYGAYVAAHWASRNPDRCLGAVLVDGAYPYDWLDEAEERRIRKLFQRLNWVMPVLRPTGLAPRMTAEQQADSNIELGMISRERELGPVLDRITVPMRYVVATGTSFGDGGEGIEKCRQSLDAVVARNPKIQISAKVSSNHTAILRKDSPAVAVAIREVASIGRDGT